MYKPTESNTSTLTGREKKLNWTYLTQRVHSESGWIRPTDH